MSEAVSCQLEGLRLFRAGDYAGAEACLRQAVALAPHRLDCWTNLAAVLGMAGRLAEAEGINARLLELAPQDRLVLRNQAVVCASRNKMAEALRFYAALERLGSNDPELALNAAYALLKAGQWQAGWQRHEARFHPALQDKLAVLPTGIDLPRWQGEPLDGRRLLVLGEQGLGDQIMFGRYLPLLRQQGAAHVGTLVSPPLVDAFAQACLADAVYGSARQIAVDYAACYCFIGSLPLLLGLPDPQVAWSGPYLQPSGKTRFVEHRQPGDRRLRIGVVWSGNTLNRDARYVAKYRFFDPAALAPLFECPECACFSLQHGSAENALQHSAVVRLGGQIHSIQDTVDAVAEMDAIICADTSIAHVAGALGKPTYVLLPCSSDWRWGVGQATTAWYPSVRLYRSEKLEDWENLVNDILPDLRRTPGMLMADMSPVTGVSSMQADMTQAILKQYGEGRYVEVEALAREMTKQWPHDGFAWKALGTALCLQGRMEAALPFLREAARLMPRNAEVFNSLGNALKNLGRLEESLEVLGRAALLNPRDPDLFNLLAGTHADVGQIDKALMCYRRALTIDPQHLCAYSNMLLVCQYHPKLDPQAAFEEACRFGDMARRMARPWHSWPNAPDVARRLRVGLVSADFGSHPVGRFLQGILKKTDPAVLEIFAYSNRNDAEDAVTRSIKRSVAIWRDIWGIADEKVAQLIHDDAIDILVDLGGHTGGGRPSLFAWKPAPVQVAWLGYFATTGVREIDYILADRWVLPPDEEAYFVERPWRLPDIYYCYTPPMVPMQVAPLPAQSTGNITFGCFNNLTKVSDQVIACWSRILDALPASRLFLKSKQLRDDGFREKLLQRFAIHGILAEKLILEPDSPRRAYLAAFGRVDIALDPFPFPGGATTVEGLWAGVPVVTLRGDRFIAHQGETILHAVGLDDWIAADTDDYVAKTLHFSADIRALATLRAGLRVQVLQSPLFDAKRFARNLEAALRDMWRTWIVSDSARRAR